jgi:hypothetical protein
MWWMLGGVIVVLIALFLVPRLGVKNIGRHNAIRSGAEPSSWEGYFTNVPEAVPLRGVFTFSYEDVEGSYSHRTVDVLMIIPRADRTTLFGLCHERHEYRHFNLARVTKMVDVESGQVIEDPRLELMGRCRAARGRPGRDGDRP